jgi:hypothetical protein
VVISEGVTGIGNGAFYECQNLTKVVIPNTVGDLGSNTFEYCTSLKVVKLGSAVTNIGSYAFSGCSQLQTITVPASVLTIGTQAFASCSALTNVFFAGDAPAIGSSIFSGDKSTSYYLPQTSGWFSPFASRPAVLWNPVIQTSDAGFGVQGNEFGFNITGTTNIPIVVEACTNLGDTSWILLQSCTVTNGLIHFRDPAGTSFPSCIYRIRSP